MIDAHLEVLWIPVVGDRVVHRKRIWITPLLYGTIIKQVEDDEFCIRWDDKIEHQCNFRELYWFPTYEQSETLFRDLGCDPLYNEKTGGYSCRQDGNLLWLTPTSADRNIAARYCLEDLLKKYNGVNPVISNQFAALASQRSLHRVVEQRQIRKK